MQQQDAWTNYRTTSQTANPFAMANGNRPAPAHGTGLHGAAPQVPPSFQTAKVQSPFQEQPSQAARTTGPFEPTANACATPPVRRPAVASPFPQQHQAEGNPNARMNFHGNDSSGYAGNFDVSYKPNEALRKFNGESSNSPLWADRMKDHLARSNPYWKVILKNLEMASNPITRDWLVEQFTHGVNAWTLSEKLETFICTWVNDALYSRRSQFAGVESQAGNGFEIWRKLYLKHHGGAEAVKLGGIR